MQQDKEVVLSVACHCHSSCLTLSPGNVIIATGMATVSDVLQNLGHQYWKPEQERRKFVDYSVADTHKKNYHSC